MKINNSFSTPLSSTQELLTNKLKNTLAQEGAINQKNFTQIDTLLKDLFSQSAQKSESNTKLLNILKQLPIFKSFGGLSKELSELNKTLKSNEQIDSTIKQNLQNATLDIKKIDSSILKNHLSKSGIFLENYLKDFSSKGKNEQQIFENIKTNLLELSQSNDEGIKTQANKIISQLEYFGLFSYLNDSNKIPLNLDWDELNDGNIEFYKSSNELHTCSINLQLEHFGEIKINLSYDNNEQLNVAFMCEKEEFKNKIQENLPLARNMLYQQNLNLQSMGVHILNESKEIEDKFNENIDNTYEIDVRV